MDIDQAGLHPSGTALAGNRALIAVLAAGAFLTALNVTMLSPLLVGIARTFNISEASAGQLVTVTAASSGVMAVCVAPWMDRYSRRFWLQLECSVLAIGTLITATAPAFGLMFVGRAIAGFGGAVIAANCLAACSDLFVDKAERNRAIGLITSALTLGAVIGLPMITLISDWTRWRIAIAIPIPLAAVVILGTFRIPAPEKHISGSLWRAWKDGYVRVLASRETVWLLASEVVFMMVWFGWLIYFGALTETVYGVSAALLSLLFLAGGGAELIANNLAPLLIKGHSPRTIAYIASIAAAINLALIGIAYDRDWALFPFIIVASGTASLAFICINIALLDSLPGDSGAAMSLQSACLELGGALGVALTGTGLAVFDDYKMVYRGLGALMPIVIVLLWLSERFKTEPETAVPVTVAIPT